MISIFSAIFRDLRGTYCSGHLIYGVRPIKNSKNLFPAKLPSGPRLAAVRPHLHGDPCPSGSEPLILTYNFGILHILSQNARFMLNLTGQLGWPTL